MIEYSGKIRVRNPVTFFERQRVSDTDLRRYTLLIQRNKEEQAMDEFISKYLDGNVDRFNQEVKEYLRKAQEGEMPQKQNNNMLRNITLLTATLGTILSKMFGQFARKALAPKIFKDHNITNPRVKQQILNDTVAQFQSLTTGAMAETQKNILSFVRSMQTQMIIENQKIDQQKIIGNALEREIKSFEKRLKKQFKNYYTAMEEGKTLLTRRFGPGGRVHGIKIIPWNLESYLNMSIRTTMLNVDRKAAEVNATVHDDKVVEYYLRDHRKLKGGQDAARKICKTILKTRRMGKSLLALDEKTALFLDIDSIETAKDKGAMGVNCRHSIRRVSRKFAARINKIIKKAPKKVKAA